MHLLEISSYPVRWQRLIRGGSLLFTIIALEGIGTFLWLIVHPSESTNRFFLAYSLERWIIIFITGVMVLGFLYILWAVKSRIVFVEGLIKFFEQPKHERWLLVSVTSLLVVAMGLMVWLPSNEIIEPYFMESLPLFLWGTTIVAQIWVCLIVFMRQNIFRAFKDYFPVNREKQIYSIKETNRYLLLAIIGISLIYLVLQIKSYLAVREAAMIGDTWSYLQGASLDFNDPAFYSERRPWGILLIYKILGSSQACIEIFQHSISSMAWLWLAWLLARSIQNQIIKLTGFIVTLGFSLSPTVQSWNHAVLSESLSISLMVLILATFVHISQQWKWGYFLLLIPFFVFWMSIREANAYIALFVAFALLLMGFARSTFRIYWLLSFLICVVFSINYQLSSKYALPRWALPLAEVITHRILPEREYLEYFTDNGMPVTPELMMFSGKNANSDNYAIINSKRLRPFSRWLFNDAKNVYVKFLLSHPGYTVASPLADIKSLLGYNYYKGFDIPGYSPALPTPVNEFFYPIRLFWLYLWLSIFAVGFILVANLHNNKGIYWITILFLLLTIPQLYLIWHGDALDVERHAVVMNIQFHLGIWWLVILHIDTMLISRKMRRNSTQSIR